MSRLREGYTQKQYVAWPVLFALFQLCKQAVLADVRVKQHPGRPDFRALGVAQDANHTKPSLVRYEMRKQKGSNSSLPKEAHREAHSLFEFKGSRTKTVLKESYNKTEKSPMHLELQEAVTPQPLVSMPPIVEQYPNASALGFASLGALFFGCVCLYGHYEDKQLEVRRRQVRIRAANAAMRPYGMASVPIRGPPGTSTQGVLASAAGSLAGFLTGEVPTMKKQPRGFAMSSSASTSSAASEASFMSASSGRSMTQAFRPRGVEQVPGIRNGTVLRARVPEVIFASSTSWQEIGELQPGQRVLAAGPPQFIEDYVMIPIQPRGAVDIKVMEIVWEE